MASMGNQYTNQGFESQSHGTSLLLGRTGKTLFSDSNSLWVDRDGLSKREKPPELEEMGVYWGVFWGSALAASEGSRTRQREEVNC